MLFYYYRFERNLFDLGRNFFDLFLSFLTVIFLEDLRFPPI